MKYIFLLMLFVLNYLNVSAQQLDTLNLQDQSQIICHIEYVDSKEVRYYIPPDTLMNNIAISDIFSIHYANGTVVRLNDSNGGGDDLYSEEGDEGHQTYEEGFYDGKYDKGGATGYLGGGLLTYFTATVIVIALIYVFIYSLGFWASLGFILTWGLLISGLGTILAYLIGWGISKSNKFRFRRVPKRRLKNKEYKKGYQEGRLARRRFHYNLGFWLIPAIFSLWGIPVLLLALLKFSEEKRKRKIQESSPDND